MRARTALALWAFALGACAHAQSPMTTPGTTERWQRIMQQMRRDSAAADQTAPSEKAAAPYDNGAIPAGVDISKFELPIQYNEQVQQYIDLFSQRRKSTFVSWLHRMTRYRSYIEERLQSAGLPRELVYLPVIESGYDVTATSSANAVGIWQFMAGTARAEGLRVDDYVDERRDPYRATDAAIRHLKGLYQEFGSWYLTAAAYNSGSGRVGRLLHEYGRSKGPDETFWEIQASLPTETRSYVPALIAAVIVGENPHLFGIERDQDASFDFETVVVPRSTSLAMVARAAGSALEEEQQLNPQFLHGETPPDGESEVRVPTGAAGAFAITFAKLQVKATAKPQARTHIVKDGETLSEIAAHFGVSLETLEKANRIKRPNMVSAGRKLIIPQSVPSTVYGTD
jgi:membrane-bound lytic murein transglycosylase D